MDLETVKIERMSYGRDAIAHTKDGKVVFVSGAVPRDECSVEIMQDKHSFARARVEKVLAKSAFRVKPECDFAPCECGGCSWAQISYDMQLIEKHNNVVSSLAHIAKMPLERAEKLVLPTLPSKRTWGYRNKIEMNAHIDDVGKFQLGFSCADVKTVDSSGNTGYRKSSSVKLKSGQKTSVLDSNNLDSNNLDINNPDINDSSINDLGINNLDTSEIPAQTCSVVCPKTCSIAHSKMQNAACALRGALRFVQGSSDFNIFRVGVRASGRTNSLQVAIWTDPGAIPRLKVARVIEDAMHPTSIVRVMAKPGRARKIKGVEVLSGEGFWREELCAQSFLVSAPSFFQVNTLQAENMVRAVMGFLSAKDDVELQEFLDRWREDCSCSPSEKNNNNKKHKKREDAPSLLGLKVADLYSGVGTFSVPLATHGADVVAVESASSSVRDLRRNADNAQTYIDVLGGDAAREIKALKNIDALVVDPPRAGLDRSMSASIADAGPQKIVYVSCNPATLARDVSRLETSGYSLKAVLPIDMFPQTYHVECVSLLQKNDS